MTAADRSRVSPRSAVSASTYSVPRPFLWLGDIGLQAGAFLVAWRLSEVTQWLASTDGLGRLPFLSRLSVRPFADAVGVRPLGDVVWIAFVMVPVTLLVAQALGGYRPILEQTRTRVALSTLLGPIVGLSVVTLILITVRHQGTSRALIFSFALLSAIALLTWRMAIRAYKHRRLLAGDYARNLVVIAPAASRASLIDHLTRHLSPNLLRPYGYLGLGAGDDEGARPSGPVPYLGNVEALGDLLVHRPIHEVVVVQGSGAERWLPQVIEQCEYFQVTVHVVPEALLAWASPELRARFHALPLMLPEVVVRPRLLDSDALFIKRVFDMVVSGVLLALLAPVFLLIAIAIKLTTPRLPVFYPWRVVGYQGRAFTGYKFTTMVADADDRKSDLMHLNEMSGPVFKIKNDPRMTPLGRWLRKFSLNELPQLWSVLKGDMSLVGPRPAYPHELERYELWQKRKLSVQPGMTCLWQVRGRNRISKFDDWVRMDFEYIDNWSLWLDCRILLRTVYAVIGGSGS